MRTMNFCKFAMLLVVAIGFSSCGDEYYYDDEYLKNSTEKLCGILWQLEEYEDIKTIVTTYNFSPNGVGKEIVEIYREGIKDPIQTTSKRIEWKWINNMEGIEVVVLDTPKDRWIYFDNVWVRDYYLMATIDGKSVVFRSSQAN